MTDQELQKLVEQISESSFKLPFQHQAYFNSRLKTTGGRYLLKSHAIEINPLQLNMFGQTELINIIKHELCHYHLHLAGKGYQHKDPEFKQLLTAVGGTRYCQSTGIRRQFKTRRQYICSQCGLTYERKRKIDTQKYRCGKCMGKLRFVASFRQTGEDSHSFLSKK